MAELRDHVAREIGPIAKPRQILLTPELPKTRSGKIMRRLLRDVADDRPLGDVTTLLDPTVVNAIKDHMTDGATRRNSRRPIVVTLTTHPHVNDREASVLFYTEIMGFGHEGETVRSRSSRSARRPRCSWRPGDRGWRAPGCALTGSSTPPSGSAPGCLWRLVPRRGQHAARARSGAGPGPRLPLRSNGTCRAAPLLTRASRLAQAACAPRAPSPSPCRRRRTASRPRCRRPAGAVRGSA